MTFSQKTTIETKNDDPSRLFSLFCSSTCYPFDGHATCMKPAKTHKLNCKHFCSPKMWFQLSFARYNREQLGKYTGKTCSNYWSWDKGMVWWFTRKIAKPMKGHHFQHYKHITRLFPYDFPIISLVVPYYFPTFPLLFPIVSTIYLLFPS